MTGQPSYEESYTHGIKPSLVRFSSFSKRHPRFLYEISAVCEELWESCLTVCATAKPLQGVLLCYKLRGIYSKPLTCINMPELIQTHVEGEQAVETVCRRRQSGRDCARSAGLADTPFCPSIVSAWSGAGLGGNSPSRLQFPLGKKSGYKQSKTEVNKPCPTVLNRWGHGFRNETSGHPGIAPFFVK